MTDLSSREVGQFPISISTSLALEGVCGIHPDNPITPAPLPDYEELWINLRTIFRNLVGSVPSGEVLDMKPIDIYPVIFDEMEMISSIINEESKGKVNVIFYYSNYSKMESTYPYAYLKMDTTSGQHHYTNVSNAVMKLFFQECNKRIVDNVKIFEMGIVPPNPSKALIITHYAYDLLSSKNFTKLTLLESHTGVLKDKPMWYTKYNTGKTLSNFPFNKMLLQVFGDGTMFRPFPVKLRRELIELAEEYKWTPLTTREKIVYCIDKLKDPLSVAVLKQLLKGAE